MQSLKKIIYILSPSERKQAVLLLLMVSLMAFLDVLGVASILPFMAILANPELVESNPVLVRVFNGLGFHNVENFLFFMGVFVFAILFISLSFKALTSYAQLRFAYMREYSIGKRLVEGYLHQPYSWYLTRSSADLSKNIVSELNIVVGFTIMPLITLAAQGLLSLTLLILLIFIDPELAVIALCAFGTMYFSIYKITRRFLSEMGEKSIAANKQRYKFVNEAFVAVKEIKLYGLEHAYTKRFALPAHIFARQNAMSQSIGQLPRFVLEAFIFGGMLMMVLYLMLKPGGITEAVPIIALYAFAGYRLMPALQQVYLAITQIKFSAPALNIIYEDFIGLSKDAVNGGRNKLNSLSSSIVLDNVSYQYPNSTKFALKNLTLKIKAFDTVAFVGSTGSGKTTAVDLIMGLLEAQKGTLEVDGVEVSLQNRRSWQQNIGYVPQQIFLSDNTISENIAFGVDPSIIDNKSVERAAKIANLHEFVMDLPNQYNTMTGERGIRLSGGQRQRIGIARALYHIPKILIMDEATSALDNITENDVMEAIKSLEGEITIILIAHRLSTVTSCDKIYMFDKGELHAEGTFDELINSSEKFRLLSKQH